MSVTKEIFSSGQTIRVFAVIGLMFITAGSLSVAALLSVVSDLAVDWYAGNAGCGGTTLLGSEAGTESC